MKHNSNSIIQKGHKIINNSYINKRNGIINSLRRLTFKLKFTQKAFYQALYFTDLILSQNTEVKIDLTAICCLLIAGMDIDY